jgi:hypothetical protein
VLNFYAVVHVALASSSYYESGRGPVFRGACYSSSHRQRRQHVLVRCNDCGRMPTSAVRPALADVQRGIGRGVEIWRLPHTFNSRAIYERLDML